MDLKKVELAYQHAMSLSSSERESYLDELRTREPEFAAELENLIENTSLDDAMLKEPIEASAAQLSEEVKDPWVGRELGAYRIIDRIAAGGMGTVFLAERKDQQFEHRVAVKIMSAQLLASDAVVRFKAERQILANLKHPYIAQLHDGGTTENGLPYLVMEYVEGQPIDSYCADQNLGIDQRLRLFQKVCEAVDFAHRNLTVHRDLKPSNILIDTRGDPKLLDFGIAKLLNEGNVNVTAHMTRAGIRAMTPEYASPEQVRGQPISVATDVYSLGVLLYRLMTGTSPYGSNLTSPLEYERAIIEYDPQRPSTVVTQDPEIAANAMRDIDPRQLRKRLLGDLDNIVLKTLNKQPEQRYLTVGSLAADIERFLKNQPVEARGADWIYKARKFAVRNARGLLISGAAVATIVSLVGFYTIKISDERDRATIAAAQSKEVSSFLSKIYESASPIVSRGEIPTALDLLRASVEEIAQLDGQPLVQAELYRVIGNSFTALGEYETAKPLVSRSVAIRDNESFGDKLALADSLESLSEVHRLLEEDDVAISSIRRALDIREAELGQEHPEYVRTFTRLAVNLKMQADADPLPMLEKALELKRRITPKDDRATLDILGNLAVELDNNGRYDEAVAMGHEVIALSEQILGETHPDTVIRMGNLALVLGRLYRLDEAERQFAKTVRRAKLVWPANHPRLAFLVQGHAAQLEYAGRFEEGRTLHEESAQITLSGAGENSPTYSGNLFGMGRWHMRNANYEEAIVTLQRGYDIARGIQDENGSLVVLNLVYLGEAKRRAGQTVEAEGLLRQAVKKQEHLARQHVLVAQLGLATLLSETNRFSEAEQLFRVAIEEGEASFIGSKAPLIEIYALTAGHFRRSGNMAEALRLAELANSHAESELPQGSWMGAFGILEYARVLDAVGREDDAKRYYSRAHNAFLNTFGADDPRVVELADRLK